MCSPLHSGQVIEVTKMLFLEFPGIVCGYIVISSAWLSLVCGALEWHLVDNGTTVPSPTVRRDTAIGFDEARNRLIVFGGRTVVSDAEMVLGDTFIYDINRGRWQLLQNLASSPEPRFGMVYGVSREYFYVATGKGSNRVYFDDIWRFDLRTLHWEQLKGQKKPSHYTDAQWVVREESALGPEPRFGAAGGIFPNASRFYLSLGFSDVIHKDTFSYSIPDYSWYIDSVDQGPYHPSYPHSRYLHAGTMISEDELLIFGGCLSGAGAGGPCPSSDSWVFNGKTKVWHKMGSCASPRTRATLVMLPIQNGERRVVLYGGQEDGPGRQVLTTIQSPRKQVAILNPDTGDWVLRETLGTEPSKRSSVAMVTGKNGIYMFGGFEIETNKLKNDLYFLVGHSEEADRAPKQAECNPTFFSLIILHGVLMVLAWGFFLPWGAFIARYARHNEQLWFNLHKLFQIFGLILGILGFICAVLSVHNGHFKFVHAIVGLAATVISVLQPFGAIFRPSAPEPHQRKSLRRFLWEIVHAFVGRCGILLGLANISLGVFLAHSNTIIWAVWFGYLSFLILTHFVAEISYHRRRMKRSQPESQRTSPQYVVKKVIPTKNVPPEILRDLEKEDDEM